MVVPPAADVAAGRTSTDSSANDAAPSSRSSRSGLVKAAVLGVLVLLLFSSLGTSVWLLAQRGDDGGAEALQTEREAVMAQARQFMLRVNTYGPDLLTADGTMPDYRELVEAVITPKFSASFTESVTLAEQTVSQVGLARTAEVFGVGVSSIDSDSAEVLVGGSFTNSYPVQPAKDPDGDRVDDEPAPFRVVVRLVEIEGEWLVDDFEPVGVEQ